MANFTDITNEDVAAGAPLSTALMTALRDNLDAVAEGATGAPRVSLNALQRIMPDVVNVLSLSTATFYQDTALDPNIGVYRISMTGGNDASTGSMQIRVSASSNGGSTWGAWTSMTPAFSNGRAFSGEHYLDVIAGTISGHALITPILSSGDRRTLDNVALDGTAPFDAIRFEHLKSGAGSIIMGFMFQPVLGTVAL